MNSAPPTEPAGMPVSNSWTYIIIIHRLNRRSGSWSVWPGRMTCCPFGNSIRGMLSLSSILIPIILSVFGVFVIGKIVTDPIRGLVNEVRKRSGEHGLTLTRVHIGEIDELTGDNRTAERRCRAVRIEDIQHSGACQRADRRV